MNIAMSNSGFVNEFLGTKSFIFIRYSVIK